MLAGLGTSFAGCQLMLKLMVFFFFSFSSVEIFIRESLKIWPNRCRDHLSGNQLASAASCPSPQLQLRCQFSHAGRRVATPPPRLQLICSGTDYASQILKACKRGLEKVGLSNFSRSVFFFFFFVPREAERGRLSFLDTQETFTHSTGRVCVDGAHSGCANRDRLLEDVSALPTWPGGALGGGGVGGGGKTLSDAPLVVNRKWHSSSSAFPPPPQLVLFLFCPMFFFVCVGVLILMSWTGRRGPAHVHDAVPEMSPSENKSLMSTRTRARQLQEATALEGKKKPGLKSF